jgi:GGDEF domain-containing protein
VCLTHGEEEPVSGSIALVGWPLLGAAGMFCALAAVLGVLLHKRNRQIKGLMGQLAVAENDAVALRRGLDTLHQLQFVDAVTGIPNAAKWKADVERSALLATAARPVQAAIIDFVDFGRLNREHGHQKVDEILRYLATSLDERMRRNERLYRSHPIEEPLDTVDDERDRIYRKYQGGDEFYILIRGSEAEMLGLLTRLQRQTSGEISKYITDHIAALGEPLRFYGSVCQLHDGETADSLMERLASGLRLARAERGALRLHWESGRSSADPDEEDRNLYEAAEIEFGGTQQ